MTNEQRDIVIRALSTLEVKQMKERAPSQSLRATREAHVAFLKAHPA